MNTETKGKSPPERQEIIVPKSKEELLCEVSEKMSGEQKQLDEQTCRAAAQLKEEIYQQIDEPSSH
ncbi:MAG: hypothetical protein ACM37W_26850 [Actinomycetota bacterium]